MFHSQFALHAALPSAPFWGIFTIYYANKNCFLDPTLTDKQLRLWAGQLSHCWICFVLNNLYFFRPNFVLVSQFRAAGEGFKFLKFISWNITWWDHFRCPTLWAQTKRTDCYVETNYFCHIKYDGNQFRYVAQEIIQLSSKSKSWKLFCLRGFV